MEVASRSGEAQRVVAAPTGRLVVSPIPDPECALELSLVIPTLNEGENIRAFLDAVRRNLDAAQPGGYEVIVVDDDSADRTWEIAAAMMPAFPELRVVRRQNEAGLAVAVIRGWQVARGRLLGTINADFQHPPEVLPRLVERAPGADLVVATRHADGGGLGDWGWLRRAASWGATQISRWLLPEVFTRVSDPMSGCYLVRRAAIEGVELRPLGYKSLMEILVRGRVGEIHECGYEMRRRVHGESKVRALHPVQYVRHVFRLRAARGRERS
ncbi:MAG: polyprenol monophosphomannose synthase [Acidobacteria bacterium]|nr:polyprenol monophosphomannose synthase [Acidobacteriota bacterium]